ncbi:MAG: glucan ABC transporter ATP-binding protein/ permease [Hyphomicrobiales bacterium]|nr:glucan ABC transporter ATP-binding protein/ permease [Hyphomicrobiales bacterium]MDE2116088.1 glucan ABC transporter ATP-binding protein/ permease [Hyphomicrobiales bacterium]
MSFMRLYGRVLAQIGEQWRLAVVLALANVALAIAQFAEPVLFGRIIDQLALAQAAARLPTFAELRPLAGAWVGFAIFTIVAGVLVALYADRLSHQRRLIVMSRFFDHVLSLPMAFHATTHSGRLLKVMLEGADGMFNLWLSFFRQNCASLTAMVVLLPMTMFLNWRLGGVLLLLVILFGILTGYVVRRTEALQLRVQHYHSELAEHASDALGNIAVIQSFTRTGAEARALRFISRDLLEAQMPVLSWWAMASVATRAASTLSMLAIFALGVWLHIRGQASIGAIVTFMNFAGLLIGRLEQVVGFFNVLMAQAPKLRDFFTALDTEPAIVDRPDSINPGRLVGAVKFSRVGFTYDKRRSAVHELSFEVQPGQTIALVGATGSGKSTAMNLLYRAFDPETGTISIDGRDIRDIKLASLRANIGVVFQEPMLFARSLEENLRIGKPNASVAELTLALERAQASEFVGRQADGLATQVSERGRSLSGGERQRLAIARALLKDPPIMIFDEATSALDAHTEQQLQLALDAATAGRTTFVIAHRLATIRNADRILVFDAGQVVESGSFDELVAMDGVFARLARAQFMTTA